VSPAANKAVRLSMWAHYGYLLLLPSLAVLAAGRLGLGVKFAQVVGLVGLGPVLMYALFLATGYRLPDSLPIALIVTLAVPLQIALSVLLFGGRSGWLFLAEDATVEIAAFVLGTMFTALPEVRRKQGWKAFAFVAVFAIPIFIGGTIPYFVMVWRGYGGLSLWLLLFATSFLTAFSENAKLYANAIKAHRRTGEFQELNIKYDGGFLARVLGLERRVKVISPFQERYKKDDIQGLPILLGFLSFFMLFAALLILELTAKS
jgi:hypothetical protein